jgi:hypothetical protein
MDLDDECEASFPSPYTFTPPEAPTGLDNCPRGISDAMTPNMGFEDDTIEGMGSPMDYDSYDSETPRIGGETPNAE